ncbi:MAG: membrane protein insertase YidC [Pseudomonadota bacterium]
MDDQNKNLILATALSFLVIMVWFVLFPPPEPEAPLTSESSDLQAPAPAGSVPSDAASVPPSGETTTAAAPTDTRDPTAEAPRVPIDTTRLTGSLSLLGGRIDDLSLKDYNTTNDADADIVRMLAPVGETDAYYAVYGWVPGSGLDPAAVPGPDTIWTLADGDALRAGSPVTLQWNNGAGLTFERRIALDEDFLFTVTQTVTNTTDTPVRAAPYGMIAHHGVPDDIKNFFILHEGAVAQAGDELVETDWDDIAEADVDPNWGRPAIVDEDLAQGWIGFTEHYWQAILIPGNASGFDQALTYAPQSDVYRAVTRLPTQDIAAGATIALETQFFAGAKEWDVLRNYEDAGVPNFIDSIDWGWFFFLTKPIFWLLHELNLLIGNMGWAIIGLTLIIKAVLVPLAYKSYVSMAKMKELQPQMEALKEQAGEDRQKLQQGMMELYKKEKVNPAAGCLPILLQIPIFFSLYKVIFVTIELRHAPWFGPFQDLSAPDPTSILNLWGLLPIASPEPGSIMALLFIGILPLLLGISMWLQQKLNPAPTDPTQQMIFAWMPWIFMFMLGSFASGLVVYWIANNVITFVQQYTIMRSQGYKPDLLGNIKGSLKKRAAEDAKK